MLKVAKENDNFWKVLIFSLILHIIMLIMLIYNPLNEHIKKSEKNRTNQIDSMTVEFDVVSKNLDHKQKVNKEQVRNQTESYIKKEFSEEKKRRSNKEQLQIQKVTHTEMNKQKKTERDIIKIRDKFKKVENSLREDTKPNISNLFSYLNPDRSSSKIVDKVKEKNLFTEINKVNSSGTFSDANIDNVNTYAERIKVAIEKFFYDASSYTGQVCRLRISLAPDGTLLDVKSEWGDSALCTMALAAARQAKIPRPPSQEIYDVFKNAPLDFKP